MRKAEAVPPDTGPTLTADRLALRPKEAAVSLGISERLLWSLTASGQIPYVRFGSKSIGYPIRELQDWLTREAAKGVRE